MKSVSRRTILKSTLAAASSMLVTRLVNAKPERLPNILWFVSEDNYPLIGAYGDQLARTPTIDKLVSQGILYKNAYCTSPVCGPSRFAIVTGMYQAGAGTADTMGSTDEVLPRHIRGYPAMMRDLGYYCTNNAKKNYVSQLDNVDMWDESSRTAHWRNRPENKPFMAVFNTFTTHESALFHPLHGNVTPDDVDVPPYLPDTPGVRQDFATFYNAMEKMDGELAAHLAELDAAGVADDTIVFYYSDNGGITPRGKRYCYELGLHCPLVVYLPPKWAHLSQHAPGSVVTEPVSFVDFVPTILSLAGQPAPDHVHGRALLGEHAQPSPKYVFSGRNRMDERYDLIRTVTDTQYRYIRNYNPHRPWGQHVSFMFQARSYQDWEAAHLTGTLNPIQDRFWGRKPFEELYDIRADQHCVDDLIADPAHASKRDELRQALDRHMVEVNDNGFIPEGLTLLGYINSRQPGAYPLKEIMALAAKAAQADAEDIPHLLGMLEHPHEVMRYWAAQGFLVMGDAAGRVSAELRKALGAEQSVAVRISLAETLVGVADDNYALITLGNVLDQDDDGPFRMQALNALTFLGEKSRPVLPAIRRSAKEDHRMMRAMADYLIQVLDGAYDPTRPIPMAPGYVPITPVIDGDFDGRFYD